MLIEQRGGLLATLYKLNPVLWIVLTFQRAIYNQTDPTTTVNGVKTTTAILPPDAGPWYYAWHLAVVFVIALVVFVLALAHFGRVEGNFSEEL